MEDGIVASVAYRKIKKVIIIFSLRTATYHFYASLFGHVSFKSTMMRWMGWLSGFFFSVQLEKLKKLTLVTNNDKNITPLMLG